MRDKLREIETPYIDTQTLLNLYSEYRKPREHILRLIKNEKLIRLKNGFYLIADKIGYDSKRVIPYEQIANMLYGPSYVSLEWALSFYGMIPERVYRVTSMTLGRDKEYSTPIGDFDYYRLPKKPYSIGITSLEAAGFIGHFLLATPEKALADLVYKQCKGMERKELKTDLIESRRMDPEALQQLNKSLLQEIKHSYRSKSVSHLVELIGEL